MQLNLTRPLIVFDIESTGTNVGADRIVEIALLKIFPDGSEVMLRHLINPGVAMSKEVIAIHGITDEMVKDKPVFSDLAKEIHTFIGNSDLAGYNSNKFDVPLLVEEFLRAGVDFDMRSRRIIDVQNIFHKMEPRTLKAAYKFYCNSEIENAHTAEADTRATYQVLLAQIERYKEAEMLDDNGKTFHPVENNMESLSRFSVMHRAADLVGHIVFNNKGQEVVNFGKHKGKVVEELFALEPSYYDWMMRSDFPLYTKKIITAIRLRSMGKTL